VPLVDFDRLFGTWVDYSDFQKDADASMKGMATEHASATNDGTGAADVATKGTKAN